MYICVFLYCIFGMYSTRCTGLCSIPSLSEGVFKFDKNLSIAAKMHHILKKENRHLKPEEILEEARALEWHIDEQEAVEHRQPLRSI